MISNRFDFIQKKFPDLSTERLILRELLVGDAQGLFEIRSNENVMRWVDRPLPKTIEDALVTIRQSNEMIANGTGINWAMCLKETGKLIGFIGFYRLDDANDKSEIGYMILPDFWRKGYTAEAMKVLIPFGFQQLNLHRIEADINPENEASIQLALKMGFIKEAFLRQNFKYNGRYIDTLICGLLKSDWEEKNPG